MWYRSISKYTSRKTIQSNWTTKKYRFLKNITKSLSCYTHCLFHSSVQSLSHVRLFATPWTVACQASLSVTSSWSLFKFMSIHRVSDALLLPPLNSPSIRVFSNESVLHIRCPKYWSSTFSFSPSNEHSGLIFFMIDGLISLQSKGLLRVFSNTTVQKHQFFRAQLSL